MKPITRVLESFRAFLFWSFDSSTGSKIRHHLKDVTTILENPNTQNTKILKTHHLQILLRHVVNNTPYYNKGVSETDLNTFPVVNKNILNQEPALFISTLVQNKAFKTVTTSGSSGALLSITQDPNKINRNTADNLYFSKKAGFKIGYKLYYLRHWSTYFKKSKSLQWLQNIRPVEVMDLTEKTLEPLIKELKQDNSNKGWLGYASGFESICKYLDAINSKPLLTNVKSIIAISEHLSEQTRVRIGYYFKAAVVSRYSNMENGILAQQPVNEHEYYQINEASYKMEILEIEQDTPAAYGKIGRIIVTDLFNYANPLIRYDTGDLGIMVLHQGVPVLKRIEGRASDSIYNTQGHLVSSFMIIDACNFKGIHQIQLIQESKNTYTIKLKTSESFSNEIELLSNFNTYLGNDASINIEYVEGLPALASGKQKITVNKYQKSIEA